MIRPFPELRALADMLTDALLSFLLTLALLAVPVGVVAGLRVLFP